jgi:hypothetical protein
MKFSFGDLNDPAVWATGLPSRRFLRFAFLTDAASTSATASKSSVMQALRVAAEPFAFDDRAVRDKSLLLRQGSCLPLDPIDIAPIRNQLQFDSDPPVFKYSGGVLSTLRGIYGDTQVACVINGDASADSADDDRYTALSALTANSSEVQPFPLIISPAFVGP